MPAVAADSAVPLPFAIPFTDVVNVMAGVVLAVATVPPKPLADTTDAVVIVPPEEFKVAPVKDSPVPSVISATEVPEPDPNNLLVVTACILP